jgi:hypothetical protein
MNQWTAGDYGGAFAGVVAGLAALAGGLAKLLNWQGARDERRARRLTDWESSLNKREQDYRVTLEGKFAAIEADVAELRGQNAALAISLTDVTLALRGKDPRNPALARAAALLKVAFPLEDTLPAGLVELLGGLDAKYPDL